MVSLTKLIQDLNLEVLLEGTKEEHIQMSDVNRPGLQFSGFYEYFDEKRVQLIGKAEWSFLDCMDATTRRERLTTYASFQPPCIIIARSLEPHQELVESCEAHGRWLLRTDMITTRFTSRLTNYLDSELAPEVRLHGVLVDVYGIGILITGESGIGKSEAALELIKRGHRLVADDAVDVREIDGVLYGSCPYITYGMLEVRGMGIIDVSAIYGMSSVLNSKIVSLVISLEQWKEEAEYDRLGVDNYYNDILNIPIRHVTLPIRPGRNIAVIIEAAAANYRYHLNSKNTPIETSTKRMEEQRE